MESTAFVVGEAVPLPRGPVADTDNERPIEADKRCVGDRLEVVEHPLVIGAGAGLAVGEGRVAAILGDEEAEGAGLRRRDHGERGDPGALREELGRADRAFVRSIGAPVARW
jgi:hypothetical protein